MKVLLMAYECSPYRGSEWAVGWGRLLQAVRVAETHVVTSEANFAALEQAQAEGVLPRGVRFYTPPPDGKLRSMEAKPGLFAYNYVAYHHWQELALQLVRELHARERFDLVHQVNVCTFREPGYTWQLGMPYLWGPVGGSQNFPPRFLTMLSPVEAFKEGVRGVSNWLSLRYKRRVREAAKAAAILVAANSTNRRDYEQAFHRPAELLLETGLHKVEEPDRSRFEARVQQAQRGEGQPPLRILWSGECQTRKALPILLRALAVVSSGDTRVVLSVLGDGPMRERWIAESRELGFHVMVHGDELEVGTRLNAHSSNAHSVNTHSIEFLGRVPFADAVAEMANADLFCFTSLRDTSGNVVLEALAAGVPVVCFDHQGAGDMVSDTSGVKIPVTSPRRAVSDWARAIRSLATNPEQLLALSMGTTAQARKFLWSTNGDTVNAMYRRLAGEDERVDARGEEAAVHA